MIKPEWKEEKALIGYSSQNMLMWHVNKKLTYVIREHVPVMSAGAPRPFILGIVINDSNNVPVVDAVIGRFPSVDDARAHALKFHTELVAK